MAADPRPPVDPPTGPRRATDDVLRELRTGLGPDELGPHGLRSTRPAPLRPPSAAVRPGRRRASGPGRPGCLRGAGRAVGALVVVVAVVLGLRAVAAGDAAGRPAPERTPVAQQPGEPVVEPATEPEVDWLGEVRRLDAQRAAALAARDPDAVRRVHAASSSALRSDLRAVRSLRRADVRPDKLRSRVVDVDVVREVAGERVVLRVTDRRSAYRLVDGRGAEVRRVARAPARTWRVVLTKEAGRWLVAATRPFVE